MDRPLIGVTGATGHIGGGVARALTAAGARVRLLARSPERAREVAPGAEEVRPVVYGRDASPSLQDVDVLLMVSAAEDEDRVAEHLAFIDDAVDAGVSHIVYTSFLGAGSDATFTLARDHRATEEHLERAGVRTTVLRDNLYLDVLPEFVGPDGVLRGPAADGRVAGVARADVVRCATEVLTRPDRYAGRRYDLTGPEALTLEEVAATITEVTGRPVRYHAEAEEEAYESRASFDAPEWQVEAWVSTYQAIARGQMAAVTDDVERLTGRRPLTLREVLAGVMSRTG